MKYRKKPVVIEAADWDGTKFGFSRVVRVLGGDAEDRVLLETDADGRPLALVIETLEGDIRASKGDWIIRGVKGELYPCKPDIFEATYEEAEE